jgi:WD40 repeat protein
MVADPSTVKVYTVNGAATNSSSSLPDWLTRKRAAKAKGKRAIREHVEGTIELIQGFEFPEASNRVKSTRDGHHVIATGTYKPQIRVWDLDQLTLKFERHSDAENVDFVVRELLYIPCSNRLMQVLTKKSPPFFISSCLMIGRNPFTYKMIVQLNCIPRAVSITVPGYHASVALSHTTFHHAMPIFLLLEMKSTVSI